MTDAELAVRFNSLSRGEQISQLARAIHDTVKETLKTKYGRGLRNRLVGLSDLAAEAQAATQDAVGNLLAPLASVLGPTLSKITQPAVEKATASLQPVLRQELEDKVPTFAIISGAILGLFLLGGILISKKWL
jgi:hypothetical protein